MKNSIINKNEINSSQAKLQPSQRFICLDVFRGLTMLGMILVDSQGNNLCVYSPLNETEWNGFSSADCVFPSFLFIMGMAICFSVKPDVKNNKQIWQKIYKRASLLFIIGMLLNIEGYIYKMTVNQSIYFRFMGVLQRTAICYIYVLHIFILLDNFLLRFIVVGALQVVYVSFMYFYKVPNYNKNICGSGVLTPECNFSGYLDRLIFQENYLMMPTDPEGLFSTLSAILNVFIGLYYAYLFQKNKANKSQLMKIWLGLSIFLIILGYLFSNIMPINKKIWTFSFALLTSGVSGLVLSICFLFLDIIDLKLIKKLFEPCIWLGMNPLFVYVGMMFIDNILLNDVFIYYKSATDNLSLWNWITFNWFDTWIPNCYLSSFIISLVHLVFWILTAWLLFINKIFIKL